MRTSSTLYNPIDRLFGWWYAIAAPSAPVSDTSQRTRTLVRKGRLTSLVLLLEFFVCVPPCFFLLSDAQLIIPLAISMLMLCIGIGLNRLGKTLAAGILVIVIMECAMCFSLASLELTNGELSLIELPWLDILIQPVLIAASLFSPKISLPLGFFNALLVAAAIFFLPKTTELAYYLSTPELAFTIYFIPIANQIFTTLVSALWVASAWYAMKQADHQERLGQFAQDLINNPEFLAQTHDRLDSIRQRRAPRLDNNETHDIWGW